MRVLERRAVLGNLVDGGEKVGRGKQDLDATLLDSKYQALLSQIGVDGSYRHGLRKGSVRHLQPLGTREAKDADVRLARNRLCTDETSTNVFDMAYKIVVGLPLVVCKSKVSIRTCETNLRPSS